MSRSDSSEDYLEAILVIRAERGRCRNVDIAEHMGVTKPSVTKALANLARKGLVDVVDRDARLTPAGRRLAEETLAKHRFFEGMLCIRQWKNRHLGMLTFFQPKASYAANPSDLLY